MIKNLKEIEFLKDIDFSSNNNFPEFNQNEIDFYKSYKPFIALNLSNKEIKENIIYLDEIVRVNEECSKIDNFCANQPGYHLNVKRINGKVFFFATPCIKMSDVYKKIYYKKNFLYNYYQFSDISNARLNYDNIGNSVSKTKHLILKFFLKSLSSKNVGSSYIYGKCGVGKTFLSLAFANEVADVLDKKVCFVYMPDFVNMLKLGFNNANDSKKANDIYSYMKDADILFIDDFGAEYATEWFYSNYFLNVLNIRMSEKKPIIFNSNFCLIEQSNKMLSRFKSDDKNIIVDRIVDRIKMLVGDNIFPLKNFNLREKNKFNDK